MWQPHKKTPKPPQKQPKMPIFGLFIFVLFLGRFPNKIINAHIVTRGKLISGGRGVNSGVWGL